MTALAPGSRVGILGGGQLGRMLAVAAARLGFDVVTLAPDASPPAARVAARHIAAGYQDPDALALFAGAVDVATYEFENIPPDTVRRLMDLGTPVRPGAEVLAVCQDRLPEKAFLSSVGLRTAPYIAVDDAADVRAGLASLGGAGILKTRRMGYDGKGQVRIMPGTDIDAAVAQCGSGPLILEGIVNFTAELSVIGARSASGEIRLFDVPRNTHAGGILRRSIVPSGLPGDVEAAAGRAVERILGALDYVGVMTVEFFWSPDQGLIANEIAPRVHNSGHWTHEACRTSQFEQHVRAIVGWPLGDPSRLADARLENLIGEDAARWPELAADPAALLTLYGKGEARPGRKMGHVVRLTPRT